MAVIITNSIDIPAGVVSTGLSVGDGGSVNIMEGGTLKDSIVLNNGWIWVEGTAQNVILKVGGNAFVNGGLAEMMTVGEVEADDSAPFCEVEVYDGYLSSSTILKKGIGAIHDGGTGKDVVVSDGGRFLIEGMAENTTISSGGTFTVEQATAKATLTTVESGGIVRVVSNGVMSKTTLKGSVTVFDGKAYETEVTSGGVLRVSSGIQIVDEENVNIPGEVYKTIVKDGGSAVVSTGKAFESEILTGGIMTVQTAGEIHTATVDGGALTVSGTAEDVTVKKGEFTVSGTAGNVTVDGGVVYLKDAAEISGLSVNNDARVVVSNGGTLKGAISIAQGDARIDVSAGGIVSIDVTGMDAESPAPISGLSRIYGTPNFTMTVKNDQAEGVYRLATDAAGFSSSITVKNETKTLGTISLDEYIQVGDYYYSLQSTGANLYFSISETLPVPQQDAVYVNTDWESLTDGTPVDITEELKATIGVDAFATGDPAMAAVSVDGVATILKGTVGFLYGISRNTIANEGVVIEDSTVTRSGMLTLKSGAEAKKLNLDGFGILNVEAGGILSVDAEGSIAGYATFAEGADITVAGTIVFDTAMATGNSIQIVGLSFVKGETKYQLNDASSTVGTYLLASGVGEDFAADVAFGDFTLTVGAPAVHVGDFTYALSVTENKELALTVYAYVPPPPELVYVDSDWADKSIGETFEVVSGVTVTFGSDAFATGNAAVLGVAQDGEIKVVGGNITFTDVLSKPKTTTVQNGATVTGASVTRTLAVEAGGTIADVSVAADGVLTVAENATLSGKAVFAVGAAVTVDGTVAFDTAYAKSDEAQIQVGGAIGGKAKFVLADTAGKAGEYLLVSGVETFEDPVQFGEITLTAGAEAVKVGTFNYSLTVEDSKLVLSVTEWTPVIVPETFVNKEWATLADGTEVTVGEKTATVGLSAFADGDTAYLATAADGTLTVVAGDVSFTNTIGKNVVINDGATLTGKAAFGVAITINGTVAFDTANATADVAQFSGFNYVSGSTKYTLDAAAVAGTYLLADGVTTFTGDVAFNGVTLNVGAEAVTIGDFSYALGITDDNALALTIAAVEPPPPVVVTLAYVNSAWAQYTDGTEVTVGEIKATIGTDAFATADKALAAVTDDGTVEVVAGDVFFTETTAKAIMVDAGATVLGKATFGTAITINGTVAFDTAYATAEAAQFNGFSYVSGDTKYTLNAAAVTGTYLLASGVSTFTGDVVFNGVTLNVGAEAVKVGLFNYALSVNDDKLVLAISDWVPVVVVSDAFVNTAWATLADGTEVTIGEIKATVGIDAFADGDSAYLAAATDGTITVIAGDVSFASPIEKVVIINDGATLTGKATFGAAITIDGTVAFNTAYASAEAAQISGFNYVSGNTKYTLDAAAVAGTYLLASGVTAFTSDVVFQDVTLKVGEEAVKVGDFSYALGITDSNALALTVKDERPPAPELVYVNSEWTGLESGTPVEIGDKTATIGIDAFADYADASAKVAENGTIEVVGGDISFDGPIEKPTEIQSGTTVSGASISTGTLTVDSGAIVTNVNVDPNGTLVIAEGGTLTGSAVFADGATVTIDGTVIFDTAYAKDGAVQFQGAAAITGKPSYELKDSVKAEGIYLFVSGIESFESPVKFSVYTLNVGSEAIRVGKFTYKLDITESKELALTVAKWVPPAGDLPAVVYVNPEWATMQGQVVTIGDKSATVGIDAFADGDTANCTVAPGGEIQLVKGAASFSENASNVIVSGGATLDLDSAVNLGNLTVLGGGKMVATGGAVVDGFAISGGNASADVAGATMKNGTLSVEDGTDKCSMTVLEGGLVQNATVSTGGWILVSSGGSAAQIILSGFADANGSYYGELTVYSGGRASEIIVSSAGYLINNGTIDNLTIRDGQGYVHGIVNGAVVQNGVLGIEASGSASGVKVGMNGTMWAVNSAGIGTILDTEVQDGGYVSNEGYASNTHILGGGSMSVSQHGVAVATTVDAGGFFTVAGAASTARGLTLANGGTVTVAGNTSGLTGYAVLTGTITVEAGATIDMKVNSLLDFDISVLDEPIETPLLNSYAAITGIPDVAITVSAEQKFGTYLLAGEATGFDKTVSVKNTLGETLGTLTVDGGVQTFDGVDYMLELSGSDLTVTIGEIVPLINGPDDGSNNVDKLWDKKAKKPVDGGIYYSAATVLGPTTTSVPIDRAKSVIMPIEEYDKKTITYSNFTGKITNKEFNPDTDDSDCRKIELATGARLSFDVTAKSAGKFVIYRIDGKYDAKKGTTTYTLKSVQSNSISVKKNTTYATLSTKAVYLEKGTYYLSFESTIDKKKDTENFYNVELNYKEDPKKPGTKFYVDDDNGDNNWLYDKKEKKTNDAVCGASAILIARNTPSDAAIQVDNPAVTGDYKNFVGFGDEFDYVKVHLNTGANLVFTVNATDAAKFTINQLTYDKKTGAVTGTKSVQSTALKQDKVTGKYSITTKAVVLADGDYYLSVQSTNAKKGGEAYYNVLVDSASVYFDNCDDGTNGWLYDKKQGGLNLKVAGPDVAALELNSSLKGQNLQIDTQTIHDEPNWNNFVGYDDEADYTKVHVAKAGTASFNVVANDAAKFVVYQLSYNKNGEVTGTKAIQTVTLKLNKTTGQYEMPVNTKACEFKEAGDYYLSVQSTNAKKGGNAYYNVTLIDTSITPPTPVAVDSLDMDSFSAADTGLNTQDTLSFGQYDADVLADASASALADLDGKSAWQNLASLA